MRRLARQRRPVAALLERLRRTGRGVTLVQTPISLVVVLDDLTYKFKKALRLAFLDYQRRAARRRCCEEEVRLNRRYAPGLYLGVSRLTGPAAAPELDGDGPILDYAVRMRTFPQHALWSHRLEAGALSAAETHQLAVVLARFHDEAARCPPGVPWGVAAAVVSRTRADLRETCALLRARPAAQLLDRIARWHDRVAPRLVRAFSHRRARGAVRECHGDLHCGNIVTLDGVVLPFDGIEFDPALRWTDCMQDLAFAWMDLGFHGRADLAARLLADYLSASGDYDGLAVLPYYRVQRALVRAKVAALGHRPALASRYLAFAAHCADAAAGAIVLLHGLSGSGKSTVADALVEPLGAVVVRSDVERKRLFGAGDPDLYTPARTAATYRRLAQAARRALGAGIPVIVDAASLQRWQRRLFADLARARQVPFLLVHVTATAAVLEARLQWRAAHGRDPSDADTAVLQAQRVSTQALTAEELDDTLQVSSGASAAASVRSALVAKGWGRAG